jgi:hypothetical protein
MTTETNKEAQKGFSKLLQLLVAFATIVSCCVGIIVVPQVQWALLSLFTREATTTPVPTFTITPDLPPTLTPLPPSYPTNTSAGSILEPGLAWSLDGIAVRLKNQTLSPQCNGYFMGFELNLQYDGNKGNITFHGLDLTIHDNKNNNYTLIAWNSGGLTDYCWLSKLSNLTLTLGTGVPRADYAFYVGPLPKPESGTELFINIYQLGTIKNATWKITIP